MGTGKVLEPLSHRRMVYALTYLYKLQCIEGPPLLTRMVPPKAAAPPERARTRSQLMRQQGHHEFMLEHRRRARDMVAFTRSFPHCALGAWNCIPRDAFGNGISTDKLQNFKKYVNCWLKASCDD